MRQYIGIAVVASLLTACAPAPTCPPAKRPRIANVSAPQSYLNALGYTGTKIDPKGHEYNEPIDGYTYVTTVYGFSGMEGTRHVAGNVYIGNGSNGRRPGKTRVEVLRQW